jgi:two-component system sensor histidine kinase/response regulator
MGGEVGCESQPGKGSTFWCTLRLGIGTAAVRILLPQPSLRGLPVLVVDDNESARTVLKDMLASMTFVVDEAASGPEALERVRQAEAAGQPYQIVYLDWHMGDVDGVETAKRIRALGLAAPPHLVMVTAYGQDEVMHDAIAAGIETYLVKPVTASLLFDSAVQLLSTASPKPDRPASVVTANGEHLRSIRGARILLVEDNELNQEVIGELLRQAGLEVDIAGHGGEALEKLRRDRFNLVLMDVQMPVMDGLTATREARRIEGLQELPIIAITANALQEDRDRCLEAGMNDYIAKPIEPSELIEVLRRWLRPRLAASPIPPATTRPHDATVLPASIEGLDIAAGLRRVAGKGAIYLNLLRSFRTRHKEVATEIRKALDAGDAATARRLAHTIKGVAGTLGAVAVQAAGETVEHALRDDRPRAETETSIALLEGAVKALVAALDEALPQEVASAEPVSVDPVALSELCHDVATLLAASDFTVRERLEQNAALLQAAFGNDYAEMRDAVLQFDFEGAAKRLEEACANRGMPLAVTG